jgi:hypothetical protein
MLTAYLWAAGPEFDAKQFHREHRVGLLRETKQMHGTRVVPGPAEWESERFELPDDVPTDRVVDLLLQRYGRFIDDARMGGASEIFLQFVGRDRDANGLYLSPEMMRHLGARGVSVDYDIVKTARAA